MQKYIWHCRELANKSVTKAEIKTDEYACLGSAEDKMVNDVNIHHG